MVRNKFDDEDQDREKQKQSKNYIVKNQVWCVKSNQNKLRFDSAARADTHISWLNPEDFKRGRVPIRSYYCESCAGYHVTSSGMSRYEKAEAKRTAKAARLEQEMEERKKAAPQGSPDCAWKINAFKNKGLALEYLGTLKPEDYTKGRMPFRTYRCKWCRLWHVSSLPVMTKEQQVASKKAAEIAKASYAEANKSDKDRFKRTGGEEFRKSEVVEKPKETVLYWCGKMSRKKLRFKSKARAQAYGERISSGEILNARPPRRGIWCLPCKSWHLVPEKVPADTKENYTSHY